MLVYSLNSDDILEPLRCIIIQFSKSRIYFGAGLSHTKIYMPDYFGHACIILKWDTTRYNIAGKLDSTFKFDGVAVQG